MAAGRRDRSGEAEPMADMRGLLAEFGADPAAVRLLDEEKRRSCCPTRR